MNENQRRINRTLAGYACSLMNDTKWREVLDLVGRYNQQVQFAFVRDETFLSLTAFPEGGTKGDCSTDCTAHGPFFLREIYALHCPLPDEKKIRKPVENTGMKRITGVLLPPLRPLVSCLWLKMKPGLLSMLTANSFCPAVKQLVFKY